jgi:SAM-dependent methyltransferase
MTVTTDDQVLDEIKRKARGTWSTGDYDAVVDGLWPAGAEVSRIARVRPGDEVLDIACGTGNAAIQAAQLGGTVTGVDLTPELFVAGRRRAAEAGVEIDFVEGDAEALPFDQASFDVVLSTFGSMFAPRHQVVADEIVRVLRPGGRIALANWASEGSVGQMFRVMAGHLPPPPPVAEPPLLWADEDHVRGLFADRLDLQFTRLKVPRDGVDDVDAITDEFLSVFPTMVTARALLEPQGLWEAAVADIRPAIAGIYNEPPSYLVVSGTKPV